MSKGLRSYVMRAILMVVLNVLLIRNIALDVKKVLIKSEVNVFLVRSKSAINAKLIHLEKRSASYVLKAFIY